MLFIFPSHENVFVSLTSVDNHKYKRWLLMKLQVNDTFSYFLTTARCYPNSKKIKNKKLKTRLKKVRNPEIRLGSEIMKDAKDCWLSQVHYREPNGQYKTQYKNLSKQPKRCENGFIHSFKF